nr:creatininase family protein [Roseomonas acroporae]
MRALALRDALAVLPVASLEQHGPHLPVWTDSQIGHSVALRAAGLVAGTQGGEAAGMPAVVLPPLWLGLSAEHLPFGGTISLDHATLHAVLRCVCRSLRAEGFRRLLLVDSHGGNAESLAVSVRELALEFAMPVVVAHLARLATAAVSAILERQTGIRHACEAETSLWLAIDPAQVRTGEIAAEYPERGIADPPGLDRALSFAERAPGTGVRGDPRAATAEKGERLLSALAGALADVIRDPALWTPPDPVWEVGRALRDDPA